MKKLPLLIGLTLCTIFSGFSQEHKNKLSSNPLRLFAFSMTNFEYERSFNDGKYGVSFYMGKTGQTVPKIDGYKYHIAEQSFSFKKYHKNFSQKSFWYGATLSLATGDIVSGDNLFNNSNFDDVISFSDNKATDISTLGLSGMLGYQFLFGNFFLDLQGGVGYAITNNLFGDAVFKGDVKETSLLTHIGINAGIAF